MLRESLLAAYRNFKASIVQFIHDESSRIPKSSVVAIGTVLLLAFVLSYLATGVLAQDSCLPGSDDGGDGADGGNDGGGWGQDTGVGEGEGTEGGTDGSSGESGGVGCFVGSEKVLTPDGPTPISGIKAGDRVISYNETANRFVTSVVGRVYVHDGVHDPVHDFDSYPLLSLVVSDSGTLTETEVTANHPYYDPDSSTYRPISTFAPGERVRTVSGVSTVLSLEPASRKIVASRPVVYNLHMESGPQNFVVNGAVVHNTK